MHWNKHYAVEGKHAIFSPSQPAWIRYDDEKLDARFLTLTAAQIGTRKHALAAEAIRLGIRFQGTKSTMAQYVNQCIGHRMRVEQPLFYSDNFFGTADAIALDVRSMTLRIFDLKTGEIPGKPDQLVIYAALFCLEYSIDPSELKYDLRIYQSDDIIVCEVEPDDVRDIMTTIIRFDKRINFLREQVEM